MVAVASAAVAATPPSSLDGGGGNEGAGALAAWWTTGMAWAVLSWPSPHVWDTVTRGNRRAGASMGGRSRGGCWAGGVGTRQNIRLATRGGPAVRCPLTQPDIFVTWVVGVAATRSGGSGGGQAKLVGAHFLFSRGGHRRAGTTWASSSTEAAFGGSGGGGAGGGSAPTPPPPLPPPPPPSWPTANRTPTCSVFIHSQQLATAAATCGGSGSGGLGRLGGSRRSAWRVAATLKTKLICVSPYFLGHTILVY